MLPQLLLGLFIQATPVSAVPVSEVAFAPRRDAPARVVARNTSELSSEIRALVSSVRVEVGDQPSRGDELVALDCRPFGIAERRAHAELEARRAEDDLAGKRLERARTLRDSQTVSVDLFDTRLGEQAVAAARVLAASAALEQARLDVARCSVRAPFDGVVTERKAMVGQLTDPGSPLLTLVELKAPQVAAQLSLGLAEELGAAESLRFAWLGGEAELRLLSLLPVVDPKTRSREVRFEPLGDHGALPGTAGRLVWTTPGVAVPAHLLVRRGDELGLFLLEGAGDRARARFLAIPGAEEGRPAFVDLPAKARIITEGRLGLSDAETVSLR